MELKLEGYGQIETDTINLDDISTELEEVLLLIDEDALGLAKLHIKALAHLLKDKKLCY